LLHVCSRARTQQSGGLLAQAVGPVTALLTDAASFAVSLCCLTAMQPPRDRRSGGRRRGLLDGLRFAWRHPSLRAMTAFSSLGNLARTGVDALLVVSAAAIGPEQGEQAPGSAQRCKRATEAAAAGVVHI
jgi:hypothetical protein